MQKLWQCILSAPRGCCRREGALRPVPGSHWRAGRPAQQPVSELPEPGNRAQSRQKQRGGVRGDRGAAVSTTLPARGATVHLGSRLGSGSTHESRRNCLICKQQFIRVKGSASGHPSIQQTVNYRTKLGGEKYSPGGRIAFSLRVFPTAPVPETRSPAPWQWCTSRENLCVGFGQMAPRAPPAPQCPSPQGPLEPTLHPDSHSSLYGMRGPGAGRGGGRVLWIKPSHPLVLKFKNDLDHFLVPRRRMNTWAESQRAMSP